MESGYPGGEIGNEEETGGGKISWGLQDCSKEFGFNLVCNWKSFKQGGESKFVKNSQSCEEEMEEAKVEAENGKAREMGRK